MCGILATTGAARPPAAALEALGKRGPDDRGMLEFPRATLGQTRLAIIDLSPGGHQPMKDNARNLAITFNGEIYNYKELRRTLEALGHRFSTQSDTEVILKAYQQYGDDCPVHLDGMFAFVIWDEERQELFMARDRFGKKPLYYAYTKDKELVIASEIKAILALGIVGELDPKGIDAYLTLMYLPPWRTVYKNVEVLPGAHSARFSRGTLTRRRYWELKSEPLRISYGDAKAEIKRLFSEAVRKRMIADVEIGAFLSGGVDSTLVTAYAQRFSSQPLKTFSLGYGSEIDELPFAAEASKAIGTDHHTLQATSDLVQELEQICTYFDEPHGDSADFPQHLVSKLAATKVKVALSGDGGDELFLGYSWYSQHWRRPLRARLKAALLSNPYKEYLKGITVFPAWMRRELWRDPGALAHEELDHLVGPARDSLEKINLFDLTTYLPGQLLTKVDQASMMHGLEVRCPLLDHQLAELVFNLPRDYKMNQRAGKIILKDLLRELMPDSFVDRKKQGFGAPVDKWLEKAGMRAYVEAQLGRQAEIYAFLREDKVRTFVKNAYVHGAYYQLWVLLCLEVWLKAHKRQNVTR